MRTDHDFLISGDGTLFERVEHEVGTRMGLRLRARKGEVMFMTGLTDASGHPIFAGDIVEAMNHMAEHGDPQVVFWDEEEAAWSTRHWFLATFCDMHEVRVIGNQYEDPELLQHAPNTNA